MFQILLRVHHKPSICKLQINAQWKEAATKFDDESTIRQFLKHRLDEQIYDRHLITFEHLERQYLAQGPVADDYREDALARAEEKRRAYARLTGTTVTTAIMDDDPEVAMFLPPGPLRQNLQAKTIIVPLNDAQEWNETNEGGGSDVNSIDEDISSQEQINKITARLNNALYIMAITIKTISKAVFQNKLCSNLLEY